MANIHTLADLQQSSSSSRPNVSPFPPVSSSSRNVTHYTVRGMGGGGGEGGRNIRFIDMLLPDFRLNSLIFIISCIQTCVFIVTVACGNEAAMREPLIPTVGVLRFFGANVPVKIREGQVFRLFCPIFLHANIWHILFNVFFQIRMGLGTERRYGRVAFLLIYFISGIYGNLFSAAVIFDNGVKVGASTSGFGLIGIIACELALQWHMIENNDRIIFDIAIFVIMMLMFSFGISGTHIDQMGHLGGFMSGVCLGFLFNYNMENKPWWYNIGRWVSLLLLSSVCVFCCLLIWVIPRHI